MEAHWLLDTWLLNLYALFIVALFSFSVVPSQVYEPSSLVYGASGVP